MSPWKVKTRTLYRTRKACGTRRVLGFITVPNKFRWVRSGKLASRAALVGKAQSNQGGTATTSARDVGPQSRCG